MVIHVKNQFIDGMLNCSISTPKKLPKVWTEIYYRILYEILGRRGNEPVGHLTQLLWPETTHLGCATVYSAIKQPPNTGKSRDKSTGKWLIHLVPEYLKSTYTVCHYAPQGNIIGQFEKKWRDLDVSCK